MGYKRCKLLPPLLLLLLHWLQGRRSEQQSGSRRSQRAHVPVPGGQGAAERYQQSLYAPPLSLSPSLFLTLHSSAQTVTVTRTVTSPWRTTTAAPTPPLTLRTARMTTVRCRGRSAGRVWRPAGSGGGRRHCRVTLPPSTGALILKDGESNELDFNRCHQG